MSSTRGNGTSSPERKPLKRDGLAGVIICIMGYAFTGVFYEIQVKIKRAGRSEYRLTHCLEGSVLFSLPAQTCCLRGRAPSENASVCGTGHAHTGRLLHSINVADEGTPFAFSVALYCARGCSPHAFSPAASAEAQTNPEAGGSK